jgi:hypothetical protein
VRPILLLTLGLWSLLASSPVAYADKRVALVIGNSAYLNVAPLANAANDANTMTVLFKNGGFDIVESRIDLKNVEMRRALRDFADKAKDADIAVVYYAGHGIEVEGINYLIPVDATLERDTDAYDEAIDLERILQAIEPAQKLRLVILDACRDNPFAKTMKRASGSRSIGRGLARVEPTRSNTLVAFAAKSGTTASDGNGLNSPFTTALTKYIAKPGLEVRKAFGLVRDDVIKVTESRQEPFVFGSLGGDDISLVPAAPVAPAAPTSAGGTNAEIRHDYELAEQVGTSGAWDAFLANYPSGFYADLARAQRDKLAAAVKASQAEGERAGAAGDKSPEPVAALTPPDTAAAPASVQADVTKQLQAELRRVGCSSGDVDGNWSAAARKSLDRFNKYAGAQLDVRTASLKALEAVKGKTARVCPVVCSEGYKADGESCTRIRCKAGFELGDDNTCERIVVRKRARTVARREEAPPAMSRARVARSSSRPAGQIVCETAGCRPVSKGCHLESRETRLGLANVEVCN